MTSKAKTTPRCLQRSLLGSLGLRSTWRPLGALKEAQLGVLASLTKATMLYWIFSILPYSTHSTTMLHHATLNKPTLNYTIPRTYCTLLQDTVMSYILQYEIPSTVHRSTGLVPGLRGQARHKVAGPLQRMHPEARAALDGLLCFGRGHQSRKADRLIVSWGLIS